MHYCLGFIWGVLVTFAVLFTINWRVRQKLHFYDRELLKKGLHIKVIIIACILHVNWWLKGLDSLRNYNKTDRNH